MPFLGKDWRSCGEKWVKTEEGWERTKVLESILDHINTELNKDNKSKKKMKINNHDENNDDFKENCNDFDDDDDDDDDDNDIDELNKIANDKNSSQIIKTIKTRQPYVYLNFIHNESIHREKNSPKLTVSEILNSLDMVGAVIDIRRFNYVCKLVQLIITEKLEQLSGNAQRTLFMIVRCMLIQVIKTNENLNIMKKLLIDFKKKIQNSYYYYFYYIGSQKLWEKHLNKLTKWINLLLNHENKIKKMNLDDLYHHRHQQQNFTSLPNDCKLEIIRRLNNGLDVLNVSKCNKSLHDAISHEIGIWKNLCIYHFQQEKINQILKQKCIANLVIKKNDDKSNENDLDWKTLYFKLKRRYGHKEVYADMIHKCKFCKCLFWKEIGHPCTFSQDEHESDIEPITPKKLINILLL